MAYFLRLKNLFLGPSHEISRAYSRAKVDRMRDDSEREKNEGERIRANLRDTVAQLAVMTKRSDEYGEWPSEGPDDGVLYSDSTNSSLEQDKNRLRAEIDRLNERLNENEKLVSLLFWLHSLPLLSFYLFILGSWFSQSEFYSERFSIFAFPLTNERKARRNCYRKSLRYVACSFFRHPIHHLMLYLSEVHPQ